MASLRCSFRLWISLSLRPFMPLSSSCTSLYFSQACCFSCSRTNGDRQTLIRRCYKHTHSLLISKTRLRLLPCLETAFHSSDSWFLGVNTLFHSFSSWEEPERRNKWVETKTTHTHTHTRFFHSCCVSACGLPLVHTAFCLSCLLNPELWRCSAVDRSPPSDESLSPATQNNSSGICRKDTECGI